MMTHQSSKLIKTAVAVLIWVALAIPTLATFAAETPPASASAAPSGLGLMLLLIGLAAIGLVGLTIYGRMMPVRAGNFEIEDDELIRDDEEQ
jgi:hypothetical protein